MAYQYDEMGNVIGEYESDEERRRREAEEQAAAQAQARAQAQAAAQAQARAQAQAAAQQPVKQTVTYNPDGTKEMTIRGTPEALSPMNPYTPTVSGPVAPMGFQGQTDEFGGVDQAVARQAAMPSAQPTRSAPSSTFDRMIQAESGGRQTNAQGQVLTSPKGALGIAQVMPTTAMDPGYGVKNIFDLAQERGIPFQTRDKATAEQLLSNRELNQEFGANYYAAMNRRFDGGPAAVAAYNAGPGRVAQNMQTNMGQLNVAQLPQETQGYLQKVSMPRPTAPVAPGQMPQPDSVINNQMTQNEQRQAPALNLPPDPFQQYLNLQDNPKDLINFGYDTTVPENLQQRARARAQELLTQEQGLARAKEQLPTMTETEIARALREKTTGGSYFKAVLFGILGMENSAMAEAAKLGIGKEQSFTLDGKPVMVKVAANGTPIEGYNPETGRALTAKELVMSMGGGASKVKPDVSMQDVEATINGQKVKGRVTTTYNAQNQPTTRVESGGKFYEYNGAWNPVSISTAATKAEDAAAVKLRYAGPTSYTEAGAKAAGEFNFQNGTNIGYATQTPGAPLVDLTTGKPVQVSAGGVISVTQTGTPGVATGAQTPADITAGKKVTEAEQIKFIESKKAIGESSNGGLEIGNARRQQLELIKQNPSILNIMNGSGDQYDKARNLIVRMASGAYSDENKEALYKDIQALKFGPGEEGALTDFANLNTGINAKTLKANSGAGAISNAEQQANKDANIGNVDRITAYAAMSGLHRSQFAGDLAASKQMFLDKRPDLKTDAQFNSAWQKQEAIRLKEYQAIAKARFDVMGKPPEANASKEAMAAYKDRVFRAFEAYPAPQFDSVSGTWNYQTANAKRAAMAAI
jgi:hypothetical protein